jgi:hypothetical protein
VSKGRVIRWSLLVLLIVFVVWGFAGAGPFAQGVREILGTQPDEPVLAKQFSLAPRGFRYYTFSLPRDTKNAAIVGKFNASAVNSSTNSERSPDSIGIEVLVLSESGFDAWQKGSTGDSIYKSERTSQARFNRNLPAMPGVYYIVFSNRTDSAASKSVNATMLLHYGSWLPEWLRHDPLK